MPPGALTVRSGGLRVWVREIIARLGSGDWGVVAKSSKLAGIVAQIGLAGLLAACGGDSGSGSSAVTVAPTVSPTPTPSPTQPSQSLAAVTTIDVNALDNYAAPALPAYYDDTVTALDNIPAGTGIDNRIATLGRVLFYDKQLSFNGAISCASCHQQATGFDDPSRFSTGFTGSAFTSAHAMRLGNVRYWQPGSMFWNRRTASLEAQATEPIVNAIEMGWTDANGGLPALVTRLQALTYYRELFTLAYGDTTVTTARMQQAIAQFQRAMISFNSRWDTAYAQVFNAAAPNRNLNVNLPGFSLVENRGRQLFILGNGAGGAGCASCHVPPTFALAANSRSNGLDAGETTVFKSPSLKSVGLSRAFMHDGRFSSLDQVVEHYSTGIQLGPALDNRLRNGANPERLNLSADDKAALVAFLQTLTDTGLTADPKFSNPFR